MLDTLAAKIIIAFAIVNCIAFFTMVIDKIKSTNENSSRISEGMLFFMATIFGSVGIYIGMFALRHKTRKWYFIVGIPLIILQNTASLYVLYLLWK